MKLILDTHTLIWAFVNSPRLGPGARALIGSTAAIDCGFSDVSLAETARLITTGKISLAPGVTGARFLWALTARATPVAVSPDIAWLAASLVWPHRDPCDRQIVATALIHQTPLLTVDREITRAAAVLGLSVVW